MTDMIYVLVKPAMDCMLEQTKNSSTEKENMNFRHA